MKKFIHSLSVFLFFVTLLLAGCKRPEAPTTGDFEEHASEYRYLLVNPSDDATEQGVVISKSEEALEQGDRLPNYAVIMKKDLIDGTTYYYKAYAVFEGVSGTQVLYGEVKSFKYNTIVPLVTTHDPDLIQENSAFLRGTVSGNIINSNEIKVLGLCWSSLNQIPHSADSGVTSTTQFSMGIELTLGSLAPSRKYYVRAYAISTANVTTYGEVKSFTTLAKGVVNLPVVTTEAITSITNNSAISGGHIDNDGGGEVTESGICWSSTNNTPDINDSKTNDNVHFSVFTSNLTSLKPGTTYYVRAYATNSAGTAYGNVITFTTLLQIGQIYQGGKIAYILKPGDAGYDANVQHGLIGDTVDLSAGAMWGCTQSTTITDPTWVWKPATDTAYGTGESNTNFLIANYTASGCDDNWVGAPPRAYILCANLTQGGYSDWFLPSRNELEMLTKNNVHFKMDDNIGTIYSSSSQNSLVAGSLLGIGINGTKGNFSRLVTAYHLSAIKVRAVRYF